MEENRSYMTFSSVTRSCTYELSVHRLFLWVLPANLTGIFVRGLKLCGESKTLQVLLVFKKKIGGNRAFFRDNKASI